MDDQAQGGLRKADLLISGTYDLAVDAAYLYLTGPGPVEHTYTCDIAQTGSLINLDFDVAGQLRGIEVLDASAMLPAAVLARLRAGTQG